jgi:hypothetical protein
MTQNFLNLEKINIEIHETQRIPYRAKGEGKGRGEYDQSTSYTCMKTE